MSYLKSCQKIKSLFAVFNFYMFSVNTVYKYSYILTQYVMYKNVYTDIYLFLIKMKQDGSQTQFHTYALVCILGHLDIQSAVAWSCRPGAHVRGGAAPLVSSDTSDIHIFQGVRFFQYTESECPMFEPSMASFIRSLFTFFPSVQFISLNFFFVNVR